MESTVTTEPTESPRERNWKRISVALAGLLAAAVVACVVLGVGWARSHGQVEADGAAARAAERVVVGMPLTLRGHRGSQAAETTRFVEALREVVDVPVETFDERFTTTIAARTGGAGDEDARAAAHLLEGYLAWTTRRT